MNDETTTTEQTTEVPAAPLPSVKVEQKALLAALGRAVVFGNGVKPILAAVQLRAADSLLHVTGCNGEVTTDEVVNARCDTLGVFPPVNLKDFTALIRKHKGVVTLKALPGFQVQLNGATTVTGFDPADYPPLPTREIEPALQLDGPVFVLAAEAALKHASRETSRYAINGVLIERDDWGTRLCGTDGRRLLTYPLKNADGPWKGALIVTRQHLAAAVKAVKTGKAASVLIRTEPKPDDAAIGRMVQFSAGGMWLGWSMELEGNFPKYSDVVPPRTGEDAWVIGRAELRAAVEQVGTVCDAESPAVRLHFNGACDLHAKSQSGVADLSVPLKYAGDVEGVDAMTAVNPAFLIDALDAMPEAFVRVQVRDSFKPLRIETPELDGPCVTLMPVSSDYPDGYEPLPAEIVKAAVRSAHLPLDEFIEQDWVIRASGGDNTDEARDRAKQWHVIARQLAGLNPKPAADVVTVMDPDAEPAPVAESQVEPENPVCKQCDMVYDRSEDDGSGLCADCRADKARAKKAAEAQAEPEKPAAPPKETVAEWLATLKWAKPSKMSKHGEQCACCGQPIAKGEIVQLAWVPVYRHAAHAK